MNPADAPDDETLRQLLRAIRVVGVVGVSPNPVRPSYFVARYLGLKGMRVIPVNPGHTGEELLGATVVAGVSDLPPEVDMLDVFRRSEHVAPIVREALDHLPGLRLVWLQIGVVSDAARAMCAERGVAFIQNRCPKIEYQRLFGELRMGGFNTGVISSKL
ncbi:MAG: CoA-binding protein [Rhodobacteraceae bacterium]|nr:CoA-binding protein [Paracoccaceae bacterium]